MEPKTYSIALRIQRTTVEECYVSVPVDGELMQPEPGPDGHFHIDTDKMWAKAVEIAETYGTWLPESRQAGPHPIQKRPPWLDAAAE